MRVSIVNKRNVTLHILTFLFFGFCVASLNATSLPDDTCTKATELGKNSSKEAFQQLLEMYRQAETRENQWCIAENLETINSAGAATIFIDDLQSADQQTRLKAAFALRKIQSEKAVAPLQKALQQEESEMQCQAAYALAAMREESSITLLAEMTDKPNTEIAVCALEALSWYDDVGFCQDFYEIWLSF